MTTSSANISSAAALTNWLSTLEPATSVAALRAQADLVAPVLNFLPLPRVGQIHERVHLARIDHSTDHPHILRADIFAPVGDGPHPVALFIHGGGWIASSPWHYRRLAMHLAARGLLVVSLDYRLAPESPFPAALDDARAALRWCQSHIAEFAGDPTRLTIVGDSCGANLAAATAALSRDDRSLPRIQAAALLYGIFDVRRLITDFAHVPGAGYLSASGVDLMVGSYLKGHEQESLLDDPPVSPIHAASRLPPTLLVCGENDPLLNQSRAMADALRQAKIQRDLLIVPAMPHGFCQIDLHPPTLPTLDLIARFLLSSLIIPKR